MNRSAIDAMSPEQRASATFDVMSTLAVDVAELRAAQMNFKEAIAEIKSQQIENQRAQQDRHREVIDAIEKLETRFERALSDHSAEDRAIFTRHGDAINVILTQRASEKEAADKQEQKDRNAFFERSTWITLTVMAIGVLATWFGVAHGWFR